MGMISAMIAEKPGNKAGIALQAGLKKERVTLSFPGYKIRVLYGESSSSWFIETNYARNTVDFILGLSG